MTQPAYVTYSLTGQFSTFQDALQAPEGAPASSGVVVEQGESCLYVKVNCRDRRGLLGDIILALKAMPLEVYLTLLLVSAPVPASACEVVVCSDMQSRQRLPAGTS